LPATLPAGVSYDAATQRFTLDPAHAAYQSLAAGATTTVTVTYGVSDGTATTPASVSWTVTGTNDAPVISGATGQNVAENAAGALVGTFTVTDVDTATGLTFRVLDGATVDARFTVVAASGTTFGQPGLYEIRLAPGQSLDFEAENADGDPTISRTIEVNDGQSANNLATAAFTLTVTDVPEGALAVDDTGSTLEDTAVTFTVAQLIANDDGQGRPLTITGVSNAVNGTVSFADGVITFTPAANFFGQASFTYTLDNGAATGTATVSIDVAPVNDAPVVSGAVTGTALEDGSSVSLDALANASDVDTGAVLTVVDLPPTRPAGVSYDAATQRFTLDPAHAAYQSLAAGATTTVTVAYGVSDGTATTPASVSWTVTGTNDAPVVSGAVTGAAIEDGSSVSLDALANASDVDAGAILSVVDLPATLPAGVNYDAATQRFTLDPAHAAYQSLAAGATTTVTVAYGVSDGTATTPASVSWTVTGTNDAPVVSGAVTGTAIEDGSSVSLDALANASDVDTGAVLTVVDLPPTLPAGVSYDAATQRFTLDPAHAAYQS
ncbi:MAG: cadherin-like domain-containing protein, partial [Hoeflea sp.]|nr:cadherin-like domain-containing protein [Hoeflea sp.]